MNNNNYTNRFLITTLIMLISMMSVTNQTLAQEAYAILDATGTLTFKYDNNKPESGAYSFTDFLKGYGSEAKKVVFDDSFRDYTPKTCSHLFYHFYNLEEIIGMKENLNTENVTNMSYMFYGCSKLSTIDLSDFNTANVTDMSSMFYGCQNLKAIFVNDSWNTDLVTNYSQIFGNNYMLYGSKGTRCETDDILYARIDEGVDKPGYFTRKGDDPFIPEIYDINGTYQIENVDNLLWFANYVNSGNPEAKASLKNNIVLNENLLDRIAAEDIDDLVSWIPIGTKNNPFKGDFSCNSYSISGLYVNNPEMDYVGLFGFVSTNAWLKNVVVNDSYFVGSNFVGGICGYTESSSYGSHFSGRVSGKQYIGGICGKMTSDKYGDLQKNVVLAEIVGDDFVGGICGYSENSSSGSHFSGRVSGKQYVGGICGKITTSTYQLDNNTVLADIVGDDYVGGLYGYSEGPTSYECYFRGHIIGKQYVGGLCGQAKSTNQRIFSSSYVSAEIDGDDLVGSICGDLDDNNYCSSCYYDTEMCTIGAINGKDDIEHNVIGSNGFHTGRVTWLMKSFRQDLSDNNSFPEIEGPWVHENLDGNGYHNPEYEDGHCKHCINYTYTLPKLEDGVYQISNADELYGFMHLVNNGNKNIDAVLTADIVVNENVLEKVHKGETIGLREWYSIGDNYYYGCHEHADNYYGIFDGQFHTISGLYFDSKLDGFAQTGFIFQSFNTIKNVIIKDSYFKSNTCGIGGIVYVVTKDDHSDKKPIVENCIFDGEIVTNDYAGGICKAINGGADATITNCINYGKIRGVTYVGGIVGASWGGNGGTVINCYNIGDITCVNDHPISGGICGGAALEIMTNCFNTGLVSNGYALYGSSWSPLTMTNVYNNEDFCESPLYYNNENIDVIGGGNLTTETFCNGTLPDGFSEDDWIAGNTVISDDEIKYTFPHLKVFDGIYPAYSIVKAAEPISMNISQLPNKINYFTDEDLNLSGGIVEIKYNTGKTEKIDLSKTSISGFDNTKAGKQTLIVSYLEKETTFDVMVTAVEAVSMTLTTTPNKIEYIEEEEFDPIGGVISVTFNNDVTKNIDFTDNNITLSGFDNTKLGEQTITVSYLGLATAFKVSVKAKSAIAIELIQLPTKLDYYEGETFVSDGGEFVVTYNNKTSETLDLGKAKITGFDSNLIGEQKVIVDYLGQKSEFKVTVKRKNPYDAPVATDDVYQITKAQDLFWFVFEVNNGNTGLNATLVNDIIINDALLKQLTKTAKAAAALTKWEPIGTEEYPYSGTFNGNGHTVSGVYFNDNTQSNVGLFGYVSSDAIIKNLGVTDSYIVGNENVGAICGKSEGTIVNCYSVSEVKGNKNVNELVGDKTTKAVIGNCYYLAEESDTNDPCAKTAEEFKSGEVATLLSQGATINGITYSGESFAGITELPGTDIIEVIEQPENPDNPSTAVSEISNTNIRIWSFGSTVYVENATSDIYIVNLNGSLITKLTPDNNRMEISLNNKGVFIVKTGDTTQKIIIQ